MNLVFSYRSGGLGPARGRGGGVLYAGGSIAQGWARGAQLGLIPEVSENRGRDVGWPLGNIGELNLSQLGRGPLNRYSSCKSGKRTAIAMATRAGC